MQSAVLAVLAAAASTSPRVHIEVERGPAAVVLVAREAQKAEVRGLRRVPVDHSVACAAPCDAPIDVASATGFFVAGRDVLPSPTFDLPATGDVTVRVRAGRRSSFLAGWVMAGVGAPALVGGAAAMTLADDDRGRLRVGAAVAGVGAAFVLTGAILVATGRTRVRVE